MARASVAHTSKNRGPGRRERRRDYRVSLLLCSVFARFVFFPPFRSQNSSKFEGKCDRWEQPTVAI